MKALEYAFNMFYSVYEHKEVQVNMFERSKIVRVEERERDEI